MNRPKFALLLLLILLPAAMRVTGHPWNFAAVGAMALFVGAYFRDKAWACIVPILAMFLSDVAMGWDRNDWSYAFHELVPVVYLCYLANVFLGFGVRRFWKSPSPGHTDGQRPTQRGVVARMAAVPFATVTGSVLFFLATNFAVWAIFPTYPHTVDGLAQCYVAGLPYFRTTIISDVFFAALFFGGYELLRHRIPVLEKSQLLYAD